MKKYLFKLLKFATIAVIVIVLVEIMCVIIKVPKISHHNINSKSQNLIPQIDSNTILFIGDSRIEWGIKPVAIKNILNYNDNFKVINLAMPNSNGLDILSYLKEKNIYPKLIITGYTSNYGRYTNHDLDKIKYSKRNRFEERFKYFLKQNFFVFDYNSIIEYLIGKHPVHIFHEYDNWGGVNVTLYGNYESKRVVEIEIYTDWSKSFTKADLKAYFLSIKEFKQWFSKRGTKIYGLSMPTSEELINLEQINYIDQNASELFEKYYDYSYLKNSFHPSEADSLYFLDGSHLTEDYAIEFNKEFARNLSIEIK